MNVSNSHTYFKFFISLWIVNQFIVSLLFGLSFISLHLQLGLIRSKTINILFNVLNLPLIVSHTMLYNPATAVYHALKDVLTSEIKILHNLIFSGILYYTIPLIRKLDTTYTNFLNWTLHNCNKVIVQVNLIVVQKYITTNARVSSAVIIT